MKSEFYNMYLHTDANQTKQKNTFLFSFENTVFSFEKTLKIFI